MKIKLLLTFDYEIFFGENYHTADKVLFEPTENLLSTISEKMIFFVDICYLKRMQDFGSNNSLLYLNQIKSAINAGHEVQFHYHPHWFDTNYKDGVWDFNYDNYSFSQEVENRGLGNAISNFTEMYKFHSLNFGKPNTYRAGGLMLQPHEKELITMLKNLEFKYDASVTPGLTLSSEKLNYDFNNCPKNYKWKFSDDSFKREDLNGSMFEIPNNSLTEMDINIVDKILYKISRIPNRLKTKHSQSQKFNRTGKSIYNKDYKINSPFTVTFDYARVEHVPQFLFYTKQYLKNRNGDEPIFSIMSHPKCMDKQSIDALKLYLDRIYKIYDCEIVGFNNL